jgi:hypothetical protein
MMETRPLRALDQATMEKLFESTDAAGLSREALRVALVRDGSGEVRRVRPGLYEITLPEHDDLAPFFARMPELVRAADEDAEAMPI